MKIRFQHLDAFRGYAIVTMILSGAVAFGDTLPGWMYHAQVPPPLHQFNPALPGITWVDLVFPFFIFAMGAAIPISLQKQVAANDTKAVVWNAVRRYALLTFFSLMLEHFKSTQISDQPQTTTYLMSLLGFVLLFLSFTKIPLLKASQLYLINYGAVVLSILLLWLLPLNHGTGFQKGKTDIIIIVLANMALFGTLVWWFTRNNRLLRLGILPFIMAIFLGSKFSGSWNEWLYQLTPDSGFYQFYFLKYLFILIPGTIAGEWLLQYKNQSSVNQQPVHQPMLFFLLCSLLLVNLMMLYSRLLTMNLVLTALLILLIHLYMKNRKLDNGLMQQFINAGSYCLLLGLALEAYEGGIKKDVSTYSYYFVTSGLAFFAYLIMDLISQWKITQPMHNFFSWCGKNPMMAYVSGSLLIMPLLQLTGLYTYWSAMNGNAFLGFLKGLVFTLLACGVTIPFTRKGLIWKS